MNKVRAKAFKEEVIELLESNSHAWPMVTDYMKAISQLRDSNFKEGPSCKADHLIHIYARRLRSLEKRGIFLPGLKETVASLMGHEGEDIRGHSIEIYNMAKSVLLFTDTEKTSLIGLVIGRISPKFLEGMKG